MGRDTVVMGETMADEEGSNSDMSDEEVPTFPRQGAWEGGGVRAILQCHYAKSSCWNLLCTHGHPVDPIYVHDSSFCSLSLATLHLHRDRAGADSHQSLCPGGGGCLCTSPAPNWRAPGRKVPGHDLHAQAEGGGWPADQGA